MKLFNYHHLFYFYHVVREGSMAAAAKKLKTGQPSLSTQIKQLEACLGQRLFKRHKKRLILTEAGQVAFHYAEQIFRLGDEFFQVIERAHFDEKKEIRIGAIDSVPKNLLLEVFNFARSLEDCFVKVVEGNSDLLITQLIKHEIDLLISNYPQVGSTTQKIYSRSLGQFPVRIFGAQKFKHLSRNLPESLKGVPFILPSEHSKLRVDLDHYFAQNHISLKVVAESQDTSLLKLLAINGHGLIVLPAFSARELVRNHLLFDLGELSGLYEEFWLMVSRREIENPVVRQVFRQFSLQLA